MHRVRRIRGPCRFDQVALELILRNHHRAVAQEGEFEILLAQLVVSGRTAEDKSARRRELAERWSFIFEFGE